VEKIGVKRSLQALEKAEIIFFLVDNSCPWDQAEENIWQRISNKKHLVIINKIDKENKLQLPNYIFPDKVLKISAKKQQLSELETKISKLFASDLINNLPSYPYLSQSWQQAKLTKLIQRLETVINELKKETYLDALCGELEVSYKLVKELSGKEYNEELLDIIFRKFCLGK
jgi:tRNA modification GTPase